MPRRSRASGVRRSCETPASSSARSCSSWRRFAVIRLTPRLSVAISDGPLSGSGGGDLAAADALDGRVELAQRPREVAREQERGDEQDRGEREAPDDRARRLVLGSRPRRQRKADPVARAAGLDAHEQEAAPGRRRAARCPAPSCSRSRALELLHRGSTRRAAPSIGRSLSGTMRTPYSRPMRRQRLAPLARRRRPRAPRAPPAAARSWCRRTARASSAARSWRKNRIVATSAIATTTSSSSASRPNSERG